MSVNIRERKKDEYLNRSEKKWSGVLIGKRKLPKKEMCNLSWDKLKRKTYHFKRDGGSSIIAKPTKY